MSFALKLDRIAARADELRAMLSEGISGEAYVRASRELSEIEPVVARIGDLRAAERAQAEAEAMLTDPEMRELAEAELRVLKEQVPELQHELRIALLPKDAESQKLADIRGPVGVDVGRAFWIGLAAVVLLLAALGLWLWKRKRAAVEAVAPVPDVPPDQEACAPSTGSPRRATSCAASSARST